MASQFNRICACFLSLCAGAFGGDPRGLVPSTLTGKPALPNRAASIQIKDGHLVLSSDWISLGGPTPRGTLRAAFDSCDHEMLGNRLGPPTDSAPGCTSLIPPGNRWYLGSDFNNPFVSADLLPDPGTEGIGCDALALSWYVKVGENEPDVDGDGFPDTPLLIAVLTFDRMDVTGCSDDGSWFIDGVLYDFTGQAWDPAYFNYSNIYIGQLVHTMPQRFEHGGYQLFLATGFDPVAGTLILPTGVDPTAGLGVSVQPMLWGTGNNEIVHEDRAGIDVEGQFDDCDPTDGVHDLARECYPYRNGVCPDPWAPSIGFFFSDRGCVCPGDLNGDGRRDLSDLSILLSTFGQFTDTCSDMNEDAVVDISDLVLFLSLFAITC